MTKTKLDALRSAVRCKHLIKGIHLPRLASQCLRAESNGHIGMSCKRGDDEVDRNNKMIIKPYYKIQLFDQYEAFI